MAGIIKQKMGAPESTPGVVGNITPKQAPEEQQGPAPEKMQAAYERLIEAFSIAIYSKGQSEAITEGLDVEKPEEAIASFTIGILADLDQKSGGKIPSELLIEAAQEGAEMIAELGESAGFYKFDEPMQARTLQSMIAQAIQRGIIDQSEIEEMMASMSDQEIQAAVQQQQQFAGGA